jgi:hypothetical protein
MALSNAERQALWRQRRQAELDQFRRKAEGTSAKPDIASLEQRIAELERENAKLRAKPAKPSEPTVDPASLSMTAQQKLETAIRQATKRLEVECLARARAEVRRWWDEMAMPSYNQDHERHRQVIESRKGVMNKATFNLIRRALHPDFMPDPDKKETCAKAFHEFNKHELVLLKEKELPTSGAPPLPKTVAELLALREKAEAERRAKRAAARGVKVKA